MSIYVVVFLTLGVVWGDWYVLPDVAAPAVVVLAGLVWLRPEGAVRTADRWSTSYAKALRSDVVTWTPANKAMQTDAASPRR